MSDFRIDGKLAVIDSKKKETNANDSVKTVPNSIIVGKNGGYVIKSKKDTNSASQDSANSKAETKTNKPKLIKLSGGTSMKISRTADGKAKINVIDIKAPNEARFELSWEQIGDSALKSVKNFVKGMFCDENGFSIKRTAISVGIIAGLAFAAPAVAALGASTAVVGAVAGATKLAGLGLAGYMVYHGGKAAIENGQKYYEAKTEAEAKQYMDNAMDGAVELTAALPAFLVIKGGANKGKNMSAKKAKPETSAEPKPTEVKPTEVKPSETNAAPEPKPIGETKPAQEVKPTETAPEPKPIQEVKPAETNAVPEPKPNEVKPAETPKPQGETKPEAKPTETQQPPKGETQTSEPKPTNPGEIVGKPEIIKGRNGMIIERFKNADGNTVRDVVTDANKKHIYTKDFYYALDGQEVNYAIKWANGAVDIFFKGSSKGTRTMPDGSKYVIELKDNKIRVIEEVKPEKPNSAQEKPPVQTETTEAKPAETKPTETKPVQETKPAAETKIDYNKIVGEPEIHIAEDGSSLAYFYNAKGEIVKMISKDESGKTIYESTSQFDNIGREVKSTFKSEAGIQEHFYTNGKETNTIRKWVDGEVEELLPIGKNLYEGVRTYPDGRKVRIKSDKNGITELGPVEANGAKPAGEAKPAETRAPEVKPTETKPAAEQKPEVRPTEEAKPTAETKPAAETSKPEQSANPKAGAPDDFTLQMQEVKSGLEKMMAIAEDPAKMKLITDPKMKSALQGFNDHANVIKPLLKKMELHLNEGKNTLTKEDQSTLHYIIDILMSLD